MLLNNRYEIVRILGAGGCGQTFLAEDTHIPSRRLCVVKQLRPATNDPTSYRIIGERFQREAALLEKLGNHKQIPALHAYFSENQEFYLVQEWIQGENLAQAVRRSGPFSCAVVKRLLLQLLPALQFVHANGIIHRDIKPDNIMLREGSGEPFIIDFGAVKEVVATVAAGDAIQTSSIVIGSPGFMPIEQASGRPVFASDIFSLGLTAIFLITGKLPQELSDRSSGHITWRSWVPSIDLKLANVLDKAIQPFARDRYQSAKAMLEAIQPAPTIASPNRATKNHQIETPIFDAKRTVRRAEVDDDRVQTVSGAKATSITRVVIAVISSYVVMFILNFSGFVTLYAIIGPTQAFEPGSYLASTKWIAMSLLILSITGLMAGLVCRLIAKGPRAPFALASVVIVLGILLAIPSAMKTRANSKLIRSGDVPQVEAAQKAYWPVWCPFAFPFVSAIGVMVGGRLKRRS